MEDFLRKIPKKYHSNLVLHQHYGLAIKYNLRGIHLGRREKKSLLIRMKVALMRLIKPSLKISLSYNNLQDFINAKKGVDAVFLKPIFDRHNLADFNQMFSRKQLEDILPGSSVKVYAYGGVNPQRVQLAMEVGFNGVVLQGSFWNEREKKMAFFKAIQQAADNPRLPKRNFDIRPVKIQMPGKAS